DAEARLRQHFVDNAFHFYQFFFRHDGFLIVERWRDEGVRQGVECERSQWEAAATAPGRRMPMKKAGEGQTKRPVRPVSMRGMAGLGKPSRRTAGQRVSMRRLSKSLPLRLN
ncbi:MAG: hypothetical protein WBZ31_13840, partial [Thiobacillus sp.]